MKYFLIAVAIAAAACSVPPQNTLPVDAPVPIATLPEVEVRAVRETPRKQKRVSISPCSGIDTGDVKENVRAKLDCLTETQ